MKIEFRIVIERHTYQHVEDGKALETVEHNKPKERKEPTGFVTLAEFKESMAMPGDGYEILSTKGSK
jgi:hypothetical protein